MQSSLPTVATHLASGKPVTLSLPETGFVRQNLLLHIVPFSKSTLWRRVKSGEFPAPIKLSARITAWRVEDVRRWILGQGETSVGA